MSITVDLNGSAAGVDHVITQEFIEGGDAVRLFGPVTLQGSGRVASVAIDVGGYAEGDALSLSARGVLLARSYGLRFEQDAEQPGRWLLTAPQSGTFFSGVAVVLREMLFDSTSNTPGSERIFSVTATTTAGETSAVATSTLAVVDLNNAPTLSFGVLGPIDEDGSVALSSLSVGDLDGDALQLVITSDQGGIFSLDAGSLPAGLSVEVGDGAITLSAEAGVPSAELELAARSIVFTPAANFNGTVAFTATLSDSIADPVVAQQSLTVVPVNDAPTIGVGLIPVSMAEGGGEYSVVVSELLGGAVSDIDGDDVGIAITLADGASKGEWRVDGLAIPALADGQALLVTSGATLSFFAADADVNTFSGGFPQLVIHGWDGTSGVHGDIVALPEQLGGVSAFSGTASTVSLTITPDNDAPTVSLDVGPFLGIELPPGLGPDGEPLVVIQNILADADLALTDIETAIIPESDDVGSPFFTRIDVTLTAPGGAVQMGERLLLADNLDDDNWIIAYDRVSFAWDADTATLSLTPIAPEASLPAFIFDAALRVLSYESTSNDPTQKGLASERVVVVKAIDAAIEGEGNVREAVSSFTIGFEAYDNAVVLTAPDALAST